MNGSEVTTQLVAMPECQGALTLFFTALADTDVGDTKGLCIPKPASRQQIVNLIDEHLASAWRTNNRRVRCSEGPTSELGGLQIDVLTLVPLS